MMRFGHFEALRTTFGEQKVTNNTVQDYHDMTTARAGEKLSKIAKLQKERTTLHSRLSKGKKQITDQDVDQYNELIGKISEFRVLAGRVRLTDNTKAHQILMQVLARLIDFSDTWDRHGNYIKNAMIACGEDPDTDPDFQRLFSAEKHKIRNDLRHLNVLDEAFDFNLTDQVNKVRSLMEFDRKLKNSVSGAIIDLLDAEGMTLTWQMNSQGS